MKRIPIKNEVAPTSRARATDTTEANLTKRNTVGRRSFLKGLGMAGVAALPVSGLLSSVGKAQSATSPLNAGDAAILRLLAAAELIESDLW